MIKPALSRAQQSGTTVPSSHATREGTLCAPTMWQPLLCGNTRQQLSPLTSSLERVGSFFRWHRAPESSGKQLVQMGWRILKEGRCFPFFSRGMQKLWDLMLIFFFLNIVQTNGLESTFCGGFHRQTLCLLRFKDAPDSTLHFNLANQHI